MAAVPNRPGSAVTKAWVRALQQTDAALDRPYDGLPLALNDLAARYGGAPALLSADKTLSFAALAEDANRYARWAICQDLMPGDVVCLLMRNCPDYLSIWTGLNRAGVIVALLNTNLLSGALAHSINAVAPKSIIVGADLLDRLATAAPRLTGQPRCWVHGDVGGSHERVDYAISGLSGAALDVQARRPPSIRDAALYIYTSGTTGLPKAARVSHLRLAQWSHWFAGMMDTTQADRMYNCLPMYHGVGGVVATGAVLVNGGSVVLRKKFSAGQFWWDIIHWDCTLFQYIGELCRYLVNSPTSAGERDHRLRLCCGNGLRPGVWEAFQQRFAIPHILEFYASTEGTFSLYNCEEKPGSIGRIPRFLAPRTRVMLVRHDPDTHEPVRDAAGYCIACAANEAGEAIGEILPDGAGFEGYTDTEASARKLLRDVFAKGDVWFRTGDLMRRDEQDFFYFVDRIGDTFRWKGENVSTTEVAAVINAFPDVIDAVVYGVALPGSDGRAGMAAIVTDKALDLVAFRHYLINHLPSYARPLFLRITNGIAITSTFKPTKQTLSDDGFDPGRSEDPIYVDDRERGGYIQIDHAQHDCIMQGRFRP